MDIGKIHFPGNRKLEIYQGDITDAQVDAIVNAANSQLMHGGGVAAAIVRKGGNCIQHESNAWVQQHGAVQHDQPAVTSGGALPCRYVIHAVGPIWGKGDEESKLISAILGCMRCAEELKLQSIAFPAISTGIYGFPQKLAAAIFAQSIPTYFQQTPSSELREIKIVLFDKESLEIFQEAFSSLRPQDSK